MSIKNILAVFFIILTISGAFAMEIVEYKENEVKKDKENESTYALHFFAEWCSVCTGQKKNMQKFLIDPDLKNLKVYLVDFDIQRKAKIEYGVERQSTIILFRGEQELARSLGIVEEKKLLEFLKKTKN